MRFRQTIIALCAALAAVAATNVRAEVSEITIAQQYGVSFLPLMVMEKSGLVEKHAAALGLPGITVKWAKVAGPSVMNDGLISGALHFASQGAPSLITLWDKTHGQIKGVVSVQENLGMLYLLLAAAGVNHYLENAFGTLHHGDLPFRFESLVGAVFFFVRIFSVNRMYHNFLLGTRCLKV